MRTRGFLLGLAGGIVGTVLVLVVMFALGFDAVTRDTDAEPPTPTTTVYTPPAVVPAEGLSPAEIYQRAAPGVVEIISSFAGGLGFPFDSQSQQGIGSGFVVDEEGYILTNAHVVDENGRRAEQIDVVFKAGDGSETTRLDGELVGVDMRADVAVIKVDPDDIDLTPLPLGDSAAVVVGEPVVAIGNPLGFSFSLSSGIVSAVDRPLQSPLGQDVIIPNGIQTDAAVNQGNSGGPLINSRGQVIGINEQIASTSGGSVGLGFAVPINLAVRSLEQLKETGEVRYAWLGIQGQTITPDVAHAFDLPVERGVLIARVVEGGPAADAGLRGGDREEVVQDAPFTLGGDIITVLDSKELNGMDDLISVIEEKKPGDEVELTIIRGDDTQTVKVSLEERPSDM